MGFYFPFKFSPKNYDEITIMENGCIRIVVVTMLK